MGDHYTVVDDRQRSGGSSADELLLLGKADRGRNDGLWSHVHTFFSNRERNSKLIFGFIGVFALTSFIVVVVGTSTQPGFQNEQVSVDSCELGECSAYDNYKVTFMATDIFLLAFTTVGVLLIAFLSAFNSAVETSDNNENAEAFFLGGRDVPWFVMGASLFASNIGTEHFVGQSGAAAEDGMAVSLYEWFAAILLILLGWVFAPIYLKAGIITVPEFLETRFNKWVRLGMAIITIIAYAATKISASIFGGYIVLNSLLGLDLYTSVITVILATGLYTMIGGLSAVVLTDTLQLFIFILGGLAGTFLALSRVGGLDGLYDKILDNPGINDDFLHPLRSVDDKDYPLIGMLVGMPLSSCWYWCMDQELVQRVLCSRDLRSARAGILMAGYLKILPPFMMALPGIVSRVLYCDCVTNDGAGDDGSDFAYPKLTGLEFSNGLVGLIVSSMIAAMMSSLSSVFNSGSTIITFDIYQRFYKPEATQKELMVVGRVGTVCLAGAAIAWIPIIESTSSGLYLITQNVQNHIAPALAAVLLMAIFSKRSNGEGALAGMIVGIFFGFVHLILNLAFSGTCDDDFDAGGKTNSYRHWWACLQFNHFAILQVHGISLSL
jgi:SSS family solute:Na+ symporter